MISRSTFAITILALIAPLQPASAQTEPARPVVLANETIVRVQGEGAATGQPARMQISIGVETTAATAAEALDANNRKLAPVVATLKEQGIAASDIQTTELDVSPQYADRRNSNENRIIGFTATNRVRVTSGDLENAGTLVSLLFDAGANSISGPDFMVAEDQVGPLTRAAETDALMDAREQAENVAAALGMQVSRVLLVSDSEVDFSNGSGLIVVTGSRLVSTTPIEPGEISVTANYNVEFALTPR